MDEMTIGDCLDYIQEYIDENKKQSSPKAHVEAAAQSDFDAF